MILNTGNQIEHKAMHGPHLIRPRITNWDVFLMAYRVQNGIGLYMQTGKKSKMPGIETACGSDFTNMTSATISCRVEHAKKHIYKKTFEGDAMIGAGISILLPALLPTSTLLRSLKLTKYFPFRPFGHTHTQISRDTQIPKSGETCCI